MPDLEAYAAAFDTAGWKHAQDLALKLRQLEDHAAEGWRRAQDLDARVRELEMALARKESGASDSASYLHNGLGVWNKVVPFLADERFVSAYQAGMTSGHRMGRPKGSDADIHIEWRVHTICWAAMHAAQLDGDFVECGVNTGLYALAACQYVDFNRLDRDFWLFDTYQGIPVELAEDAERERAETQNATMYEDCYELATANFAPYPRARLVRGIIPGTLRSVEIERVAFLSVDLDIARPEIDVLEHFWPKLVPGAVVVHDDYGWTPRVTQREALDAFARRVGVEVLVLPTGQGLLIKP